jgi:uncharacterized protein with von Willebrand factor type A (vWA) domain
MSVVPANVPVNSVAPSPPTLPPVEEHEDYVDNSAFDFSQTDSPEGVAVESKEYKQSEYALKHIKWNKHVGKQLAESELNKLQADQYAHDKRSQDPSYKAKPELLNEHELADTFTMAFEPVVELEENASPASKAWFRDFMSCDEARKLRQSTMLEHDLAEMAAWHLARQHHEYVAVASEDAGTDNEDVGEIGKRIRSVREALKQAADDVDAMESVQAGLEKGVGARIPRKQLADAFKRAKQSERLMGILKSAGKMVQYAHARRKERVEGVDDVTGVCVGGDVSRMIASEMALLNDDVRELDLMRRIVERQVFQLERTKEVRIGRGPVVVVLDESGSMDGENIVHAKAFALAMAWLAKTDKRWISLVGFASSGEYNYLTMPPEAWNQDSLLNWMDHFFAGGTDFDVLLDVAGKWKKMGCPEGKTDVIFITDAQANFGDHLVKTFGDWKLANQVKCYGISVASSTGDMGKVCDHCCRIDQFGMQSQSVREILATI